mgnify:CR=1 FL=1
MINTTWLNLALWIRKRGNFCYTQCMRIPIDVDSAVPLYRQIAEWLKQNILSGALPAGTRLPATRALAQELGTSRITVKNAYLLLESDGLILTHEGSGTFTASPLHPRSEDAQNPTAWPLWQLEAVAADVLPENQPHAPSLGDMISFTGVGDPRHFPLKDFSKSIQDVLRRDGLAALDYGAFDGGYPPLRETVVHVLASQGIQANPQEVLITSGSQQALALTCQALLAAGDVVLVEKPTYNLALDLFRALKLKVIGVDVDAEGMQVEVLEPLLQQHHPGLIYTIPNFQNPSGACMNVARRRTLLEIADRYNVPILEDDFAGDLRFGGHAQPAIKALDFGGRVIYAGTFSKMLMPGLRVGYLLANGPILERLTYLKRVQDLTTSPFMQRVLDHYVTVGRYQAHLRRSIRLCRSRRDAMLSAIHEHLPGLTCNPPQGGLFLWARLPDGISSTGLLAKALGFGAEFAPGTRFFSNPEEGEPYLRLNFASHNEEEIKKGIQRLEKALNTFRNA